MKKKVLNYYVYTSWDKKNKHQEFLSYMVVAKTMISQEISESMQILGENSFIFSSKKDFKEINEKLKHKRFPYLLIDITTGISLGLISAYCQEDNAELLKQFIDNSNKNQLEYLNIRLQDCLHKEDYENAVVYRDLIMNNHN